MRKSLLATFLTLITISLTACGSSDLINPENLELEASLSSIPASEITEVDRVIYSTLDDTQKEIYDTLLNAYENFDTTVIVEGTDDDIKIAHKAIIADNPEIFYVNGYVTDASIGALINISKTYSLYPNYTCKVDEYADYIAQIEDVIATGLTEDYSSYSDYEKSKLAFDYLANLTTYDTGTTYDQNILSTFLYGRSVCGGYSQGYSYLMQKMGIPCAQITGALEDVAHSWNVSVLDGQYYMTDLTNGDSYYEINNKRYDYLDYSYLNIDPAFIPNYTVSAMYDNFLLLATDDNYYYEENLYIKTFSEEQIDSAIEKALAEDKAYITFRFDEKPLETAKEKLLNLQEMQTKYGVTHVKVIDDFATITLYFDYATESEGSE